MKLDFALEGIEELEGAWKAAIDNLNDDLTSGVQLAAEAAQTAMNQDHPYTDRTHWLRQSSYLTPPVRTKWTTYIEVRFRAKYAGWVNDGTSHAKPYPFIPQGIRAADQVLDAACSHVLGEFCSNVSRG